MNTQNTNTAKPTGHRQRNINLAVVAALVGILVCSIMSQAQADLQPTSFQFYFSAPPSGLRQWQRNGDTWTETYPIT